jgi:hypothetical protein
MAGITNSQMNEYRLSTKDDAELLKQQQESEKQQQDLIENYNNGNTEYFSNTKSFNILDTLYNLYLNSNEPLTESQKNVFKTLLNNGTETVMQSNYYIYSGNSNNPAKWIIPIYDFENFALEIGLEDEIKNAHILHRNQFMTLKEKIVKNYKKIGESVSNVKNKFFTRSGGKKTKKSKKTKKTKKSKKRRYSKRR